MKTLLRLASAIVLALLPAAALAQSPIVGLPIRAPAGFLPGTAIYCDSGNGTAALCNFGGGTGGGSAGDPSSTGTVGGSAPATASVQGLFDGSAIRRALSDSAGRQIVVVYSLPAVTISNFPSTQAISAAALPLPSGAATAANQATANASLALIDAKLPASLGAKTAATSLSVAPATDAVFAVDTVTRTTATNRGGSFGTSATQLMPANPARRGFAVQVQAASSTSCYISGLATATADFNSLQITGGSFYESSQTHVGTSAMSIICTVASTPVYAREW